MNLRYLADVGFEEVRRWIHDRGERCVAPSNRGRRRKAASVWRPIQSPSNEVSVPRMIITRLASWWRESRKHSAIERRSTDDGVGRGSGCVCHSPMKCRPDWNCLSITRCWWLSVGRNANRVLLSVGEGSVARTTLTKSGSIDANSMPPASGAELLVWRKRSIVARACGSIRRISEPRPVCNSMPFVTVVAQSISASDEALVSDRPGLRVKRAVRR